MEIRIGKQLTQAREALGLVVEDVAHRTKIPAPVIRQLESEDYSHFPNNIYAKGFLRLYGRFLGIDPTGYIAEHHGSLVSHEEEVAYLEGIAVSSEFQNIDEKRAAATATAGAAASVAATTGPQPEVGKISSGFMTVFLLLVVGIPTAVILSNLYDKEPPEPQANPAATVAPGVAPGVPNSAAEGAEGVTLNPATVPPDPEGVASNPEVPKAIPVSPAGGAATEPSGTVNPPDLPETIGVPSAKVEYPRAIRIEQTGFAPEPVVAEPLAISNE